MIRHSLSCANLIKQYKIDPDQVFASDPLLSNWPFHTKMDKETKIQVNSLKEKIQKLQCDTILTSGLMRTIETAHNLFPNQIIYPMPHLGNMDLRIDNMPLSINKQKNILQQLYQSIDWINWKYINDFNYKNRGSCNFIKFLDYFQNIPLYKTSKNIAIFTHSKLINSILDQFGSHDSVKNNAIIKIVYDNPSKNVYYPYKYKIIYNGIDSPEFIDENFYSRCNQKKY